MLTTINLKALSASILAAVSLHLPTTMVGTVDRIEQDDEKINVQRWSMGYSAAAETRKAIIANVERLWTYYKKTYQEGKGDD